MAYPMHILVNDFAIRSFRETADKDYISARLAFRARLAQPFLWSALHCLEKYIKGILVLNRVPAHKGHKVLEGIELMKHHGKFELELSSPTMSFIKKLEEYGAEYRYYEVSYEIDSLDMMRLDLAVWELRRYCQPLDYEIDDPTGAAQNCLSRELDRVHKAKAAKEKGTCIASGFLEKIIDQRNHPGRAGLIWKNLFFGPSRRKGVMLSPDHEVGNSPFFLYPEIIDEVVKYVYVPKDIAQGARNLAKVKAAETAKEQRKANQLASTPSSVKR